MGMLEAAGGDKDCIKLSLATECFQGLLPAIFFCLGTQTFLFPLKLKSSG